MDQTEHRWSKTTLRPSKPCDQACGLTHHTPENDSRQLTVAQIYLPERKRHLSQGIKTMFTLALK